MTESVNTEISVLCTIFICINCWKQRAEKLFQVTHNLKKQENKANEPLQNPTEMSTYTPDEYVV